MLDDTHIPFIPPEIQHPDRQDAPEYYSPMLQGPGTNKFVNVASRKDAFTVDIITGAAALKDGDLEVFIEAYNMVSGLRTSAKKLFDACAIALTRQANYRGEDDPNPQIVISLKEYMHLCGVPDSKSSRDKARRIIEQDLKTLLNSRIGWKEQAGIKKAKNFLDINICTEVGIQNGNILFQFSPRLAKYLQHAYVMQYPHALFQLDSRNPNIWTMGRKLALHNSMDSNRTLGTANTISVRSLLESAPEIPSHAKVMDGDRNLSKNIITPFEKCLDTLVAKGVLKEWTYWNSRNKKLSDAQLAKLTYDLFIDSYVHFEFAHNPPDQARRLAARPQKPGLQRTPRKKTRAQTDKE